ncbi:hypothetical protein AB0D04_26995 [Streptomyces sp. NPDC048483]|uniref:hypothetical protein n=1 Tax=Streptomyces sp. NPDC048483 TaxID=3154927 RepID=UPI00341C3B43
MYRELARQHPDAVRPDLAASLNNLAVRVWELGRRDEALAALSESMEILRVLAETQPELHGGELEQSLRVMSWLQAANRYGPQAAI